MIIHTLILIKSKATHALNQSSLKSKKRLLFSERKAAMTHVKGHYTSLGRDTKCGLIECIETEAEVNKFLEEGPSK